MTWTTNGLFQRLLSAGSPESPKALILLQSGTGMLLIALTLTVVSAIRICRAGDLGSGAVTALLGSLGFLAGLAGFHRQADPVAVEAAPSPGSNALTSGCAGAASTSVDGGTQ
jgi:hypothetical protein